MRRRVCRGLTMTEIVVASALAMVVLIGIVSVDVARVRISEDVYNRSSTRQPNRAGAALAVIHIQKHLEGADRISINGGAGIFQFRVPEMTTAGCAGAAPPAPSCFDDVNNYRWYQYRRTAGNQLFFYESPPGCGGGGKWLASEITALVFAYQDEAPAPPGGDPALQDNNMLSYRVTWNNGTDSQTFNGQVAVRAGAYTNLMSGLHQPGSPMVAPPPAC